jgi:hypothetical protein
VPEQNEFQLKLPEPELQRVANRVQTDFRSAQADHAKRMRRFAEYYRRYRAVADVPAMGEEAASNVPVPLIRWNLLVKLSKEIDSILGDEAEIVATPIGPSDYKRDLKIGLYMTWRVFSSMRLTGPFIEFILRKLIFGRAVAYSPWKRDVYEVKNKEVVDYEGPGFTPLWPDDLIVPAEEVRTIHDFSYVIRRYRTTPDELLEGEENGRYQGITKNWARIVSFAQRGMRRNAGEEQVKVEQDMAEGVGYENPQSSGEWLTVLEWYGRWRPLKKGKQDAGEWDFSGREMRTKEYVVRYLWDLHMVIGVQSLEDLYPTMRHRRPFVEAAMIRDGSYWSPGMAEMLIDLEDEVRANHNQATEGAALAMSPPMAYRPASGLTPEMIRIEPGLAIPMDNPGTDMQQIKIGTNLETATWKEQTIQGYAERLTGLSEFQLGRQSDRPNAPRTATQTVKLLEEGNVRISLDSKVLREDMSAVLSHFWDLEYLFSDEQTFFRVTEEDANGAFETNNGAAVLTREDRDGRYDFKLEFASSTWSKQTRKEEALALYQLDLQNPLFQGNPAALWETTNRAHKALSDESLEDVMPRPPEPDISMDPVREWVLLQEGSEEVHVRPTDLDMQHIQRHMKDYQLSQSDPNRDPEAEKALHDHILAHYAQMTQKKLQQAIIEKGMEQATQMTGQGAPQKLPNGLWQNGVSQPPGNPLAQGPNLYTGHQGEEFLHGAS